MVYAVTDVLITFRTMTALQLFLSRSKQIQ